MVVTRAHRGFTLIELLVVVAIIGVLAAVGTVAYMGYTEAAKKAVVKSNWRTTVKYLSGELAKCAANSSERIFGEPGVKCTEVLEQLTTPEGIDYSCAAITLSYTYGLSNPLDTAHQSWYGKTYSKMPDCVVVRNNSKGVAAGDGEQDGQVSIVKCPRAPYCSNNAGKLKVMWWWDNKTMQDFSIVEPSF